MLSNFFGSVRKRSHDWTLILSFRTKPRTNAFRTLLPQTQKQRSHNKPSSNQFKTESEASKSVQQLVQKTSEYIHQFVERGARHNILQENECKSLRRHETDLKIPFKLAFIGGWNKGKSTIINSIVGVDIATGFLPPLSPLSHTRSSLFSFPFSFEKKGSPPSPLRYF